MALVSPPVNCTWAFRINPDGGLGHIPEIGYQGPSGLGTGVIVVNYGDQTPVSTVIQAIQAWCGISLPYGRYTATWGAILAAQAARVPIVLNTF